MSMQLESPGKQDMHLGLKLKEDLLTILSVRFQKINGLHGKSIPCHTYEHACFYIRSGQNNNCSTNFNGVLWYSPVELALRRQELCMHARGQI